MNIPAPQVYLGSYLEPLAPFLAREDVTDILINRPGEVWSETTGGHMTSQDVPRLSESALNRLVRQIAAANAQGIGRSQPLLGGKLPDGSRVQIVLPPASRSFPVLAIRKHGLSEVTLSAFAKKTIPSLGDKAPSEGIEIATDVVSDLALAVRARYNVLISGGTSTGKTTLLQAMLRSIPPDERLILVEDVPELPLTHANSIGLLAARGVTGEAAVSTEDLLIAALRMRPDRLILGELRGTEATTFLRAVNSGHPGSITTIHADSPARAVDQLTLLVLQGGLRMNWEDVRRFVCRSLDLIVQMARINGRREITQITLARDVLSA